MPTRPLPLAVLVALLVLITGAVVHALGSAVAQTGKQSTIGAAAKADANQGKGELGLPAPVAEMREAILEAVRTGRLDDLKTAIELNEMKPEIGDGTTGDLIAAARAMSEDGSGRGVLEAIGKILEAPWVAVPLGRDPENNRIFVWPGIAERSLDSLTSDEKAVLSDIVGSRTAEAMLKGDRYNHWRLGIGADGTWHYLRK